jgi:hypothetical protein
LFRFSSLKEICRHIEKSQREKERLNDGWDVIDGGNSCKRVPLKWSHGANRTRRTLACPEWGGRQGPRKILISASASLSVRELQNWLITISAIVVSFSLPINEYLSHYWSTDFPNHNRFPETSPISRILILQSHWLCWYVLEF